MPALGIDFYAFAGHKAYGPNGVGVLWATHLVDEAEGTAYGTRQQGSGGAPRSLAVRQTEKDAGGSSSVFRSSRRRRGRTALR